MSSRDRCWSPKTKDHVFKKRVVNGTLLFVVQVCAEVDAGNFSANVRGEGSHLHDNSQSLVARNKVQKVESVLKFKKVDSELYQTELLGKKLSWAW